MVIDINDMGQCLRGDNQVVHICMVSDDAYVMPTCVALQSLVSSKAFGTYHIHIIASDLSDKAEQQFKRFIRDDVIIEVVRENAEKRFAGLHTFEDGAMCVASISALLKFVIPELFPQIDKILYLDGDLIVKEDLNEIYDMDLGGGIMQQQQLIAGQCIVKIGLLIKL